jgi:hypothetical protein
VPPSPRAVSRSLQPKEEPTINTPADVISDVLVLAAMERAERHRARGHSDIPIWTILEHRDIPRRSAMARRVRSQIGALELAGSLACSRRHGVQVWALTPIGRRRLQRSLRAGTVPQLPESPQHRAWRNARTVGAQELDRFRAGVREALDEGARLLSAEPPAGSDAWFELGEHLRRAVWRLGSATYCAGEWVEPNDASADIDNHREPGDDRLDTSEQALLRSRRAGRRNTRLWDDTSSASEAD